MSIELRPPRHEEAAEIAAAMNAFGRVAEIGEETVEDVLMWLEMPSLDLEQDIRVAVADGKIVGYADLSNSAGEGKLLWADVRPHPDYPKAAPPLLDFVERRARELAVPGGLIKAWSPEEVAELRDLLEGRGYRFHHYSLRMVRDLGKEPPAEEWPEGISVRTFDRERDEQAVYEAHQETFSDQRDFSPDTLEDWRHWAYHQPFDSGLWFLAEDDDELAGICLCRPHWRGDDDLGWIGVLGVRRPWRQRGLGRALLLHSFHELRARGKKRAGLGVDADNPTGAARLYEQAGMTVERRIVWYEKEAR